MRMPVAAALGALVPAVLVGQAPSPPGAMVDIAPGQRLHVHCTGTGSPTVVLESGAGDFSVIWSLVQPEVARFTRVCSYDRAGYAWSDPGQRPRTFMQLSLELNALLRAARVPKPVVLVGQSFGGSLVRAYADRYPGDVAGLVLVDAVHEDGYVVYGGKAHHLRAQATGDPEPPSRVAPDGDLIATLAGAAELPEEPLEPPLDRLPPDAQAIWKWAAARPIYRKVQPLEMEWSPDFAEQMFQARKTNRALLGDLPLVVLARAEGGYRLGLDIPADSLERLRRAQQGDLAKLSTRGKVRFVRSGHNIHLEAPEAVIDAIKDVVSAARKDR